MFQFQTHDSLRYCSSVWSTYLYLSVLLSLGQDSHKFVVKGSSTICFYCLSYSICDFLIWRYFRFPKTVGVSIPMKATFFITYIMVDGWAGIAAEILRLVPLIIFHLKNTFLVKTEKDREQAMDPGCLGFAISEPRIQLYFLLGFVYCVVTPVLLPFIIVFFAFAYTVFRHQVTQLKPFAFMF